MKSSSPLFARALSAAALFATSVGHAAPLLDNESARYLASPRFRQVLIAAIAGPGTDAKTCNTSSEVRLDNLRPLQEVVMNGGIHPESGLWSVAFDLESCGTTQRHNVFLRANAGAAPFVLRLPDGETRVSPSSYLKIVSSLGLSSATCREAPAVRASVYSASATSWQEHWSVKLCGQEVRALDLQMSEDSGGQTAWTPVRKTTWR